MIVQIRGISGSGKTTVMREVMEELGDWKPCFVEGRKRPLYYRRDGIVVLGQYETSCGGCDNLGGCKAAIELAINLAKSNNVLMEGRLVSDDVKHTLTAADAGVSIRCLVLVTDPDVCVERILTRRREAGNTKPFTPSKCNNMDALVRRVRSARLRLMSAGLLCRRASDMQAAGIILNWIRRYHD